LLNFFPALFLPCFSSYSDLETAVELENDENVQESYKDKLKKAKVALKRSKRKDLYSLLGVSQQASDSEIKTAYRKAALKYHPDKQASKSEEEKKSAENMFKAMGEAYEILSNPEKKAAYDSGVEVEDLDNPHAGHGGHSHGGGGIDPNIIFQMFMQQQGGGRGGGFSF
jgi:DnaJ family protein C protein 7